MSERYAHAIYCDDIRQEVSGKLTFVGCYLSDLIIFGEPPKTLPKLCANIWISTPAENPFEKLNIRLLHDDKEIASADMTADAKSKSDDGRGRSRMTIMTQIVLSLFNVEKEGTLRTIVEADGEELRAGGLIIRFEADPSKAPWMGKVA